jgi:solute:Na+ symporter, SSS family
MNQLAAFDWAVIATYFVAVYVVVFWHGRANRANPAEFFLAGRNAGWFVVGASIFASNIGSEHLVGLAGSGASGAFPAAQFELLAAFALLLLGWLFVPFYIRSGVFTMPEFLERRYSPGARYYLAAISVVGYVLTKISVTIAAGGIVFEALTRNAHATPNPGHHVASR